MNQRCPEASTIVNPGDTPLAFDDTIHFPAAGPLAVSGPLAISAAVIVRAPRRFVNQLESGTSSTVFRFRALTFDAESPGFVKRWSSTSTTRSIVDSWTPAASW